MSSPLLDVWEAAASSPFTPTIGKDTQFTVGFALLAICMFEARMLSGSGAILTMRAALVLTTIFGLSTPHIHSGCANIYLPARRPIRRQPARPWCSRLISIRVRGLQETLALHTDCHHQLWRSLHDLRSRRLRLVSLLYLSGVWGIRRVQSIEYQ